MIRLTNYWDLRAGVETFSGARWQPRQFDFPVATWAQPLTASGGKILLRDFGGDLRSYYEAIRDVAVRNEASLLAWYEALEGEDANLCCWCPRTKTAARQISQFDSFVCHLGGIAGALSLYGIPWEFGQALRSGLARAK